MMANTRHGLGALLVLTILGIAWVAQNPPAGTEAPTTAIVTLRGFFGDETFLTLLDNFLAPNTGSPLPSDWRGQIPLRGYQQNHKPWYIDTKEGGQDEDHRYGLERSSLAFFVGHGEGIEGWSVPNPPYDEHVPLDLVHVGDGGLRYFWLYSCGVLAHGPEVVKNALNYSAPQCFMPGKKHADVFSRWKPAFNSNMRMVCGGSTLLGQTGVHEIWNYLLEAETSVADAWILGLDGPEETPVCLARGGKDPISSALTDRTLEPDAVRQNDWLHYQYPVRCTVRPEASSLHVTCNTPSRCDNSDEPLEPASLIPKQGALPTTVPPVAVDREEAGAFFTSPAGRSLPLGFRQFLGHTNLKYHPQSGAIVSIKDRDSVIQYNKLTSCDAESQWTIRPSVLLEQAGIEPDPLMAAFAGSGDIGLLENFSATALEMRVESRRDDNSEPVQCAARSLFLLLHRKVFVGPKVYPVLGPALAFEIHRQGGEGRSKLASLSAPPFGVSVGNATPITLKPLDTVIREAHQALQLNSAEYPIENARGTFGYERAPLRCQQQLLRPTYEIRFFPSDAAQPERPTVTVRRDARLAPLDEGWTCQGWGDFPPPAS